MRTGANWSVAALLPVLAAGCCTLNQPGDSCGRGEATVFVAPGQLRVKPECVQVAAGESVTLHLRRPDGFRGEVVTRAAAENGEAAWLNASGDGDAIVLSAPAFAAEGAGCSAEYCDYKYEVVVRGVGRLDPRVRVTHR